VKEILPIASAAEVRRYARRLMLRHPRQLAAALTLHACAAVAGLGLPALVGRLIDEVKVGTSTASVDRVALAIAGCVVVCAAFTRSATYVSGRLGARSCARTS
jgi:ABC-type multidrug transport system fused ATPase/permease subunit